MYSSLMYYRHRNVQIRNVAANLIHFLVENMGCDRVLIEFPDKILPVAAKFLTDSSQQVRYVSPMTVFLSGLSGSV